MDYQSHSLDMSLMDGPVFERIVSDAKITRKLVQAVTQREVKDLMLQRSHLRNGDEPLVGVHFVHYHITLADCNEVKNIVIVPLGLSGSVLREDTRRIARLIHLRMEFLDYGIREEFTDIKDTILIMVCDFDPFLKGLACYKECNVLSGPGQVTLEGRTTFYLNTHYNIENADKDVIDFLYYLRHQNCSLMERSEFMDGLNELVRNLHITRRPTSFEAEWYNRGRKDMEDRLIRALMAKGSRTEHQVRELLGMQEGSEYQCCACSDNTVTPPRELLYIPNNYKFRD